MGLGKIQESSKYYMRCPGKVTKSFELTEKTRKLIEISWLIYVRLESSSRFQEQDVPSTNTTLCRKRAGNTEVHI